MSTCDLCPSQCQRCYSRGCQQCKPGYTLSPDGNNCYQCSVNNFQACSSDNYCGTCNYHYLEVNGTCLYCGTPNCAYCYQYYALLLATSVIVDIFSTILPTPALAQSKTARYVNIMGARLAMRTIYLP